MKEISLIINQMDRDNGTLRMETLLEDSINRRKLIMKKTL